MQSNEDNIENNGKSKDSNRNNSVKIDCEEELCFEDGNDLKNSNNNVSGNIFESNKKNCNVENSLLNNCVENEHLNENDLKCSWKKTSEKDGQSCVKSFSYERDGWNNNSYNKSESSFEIAGGNIKNKYGMDSHGENYCNKKDYRKIKSNDVDSDFSRKEGKYFEDGKECDNKNSRNESNYKFKIKEKKYDSSTFNNDDTHNNKNRKENTCVKYLKDFDSSNFNNDDTHNNKNRKENTCVKYVNDCDSSTFNNDDTKSKVGRKGNTYDTYENDYDSLSFKSENYDTRECDYNVNRKNYKFSKYKEYNNNSSYKKHNFIPYNKKENNFNRNQNNYTKYNFYKSNENKRYNKEDKSYSNDEKEENKNYDDRDDLFINNEDVERKYYSKNHNNMNRYGYMAKKNKNEYKDSDSYYDYNEKTSDDRNYSNYDNKYYNNDKYEYNNSEKKYTQNNDRNSGYYKRNIFKGNSYKNNDMYDIYNNKKCGKNIEKYDSFDKKYVKNNFKTETNNERYYNYDKNNEKIKFDDYLNDKKRNSYDENYYSPNKNNYKHKNDPFYNKDYETNNNKNNRKREYYNNKNDSYYEKSSQYTENDKNTYKTNNKYKNYHNKNTYNEKFDNDYNNSYNNRNWNHKYENDYKEDNFDDNQYSNKKDNVYYQDNERKNKDFYNKNYNGYEKTSQKYNRNKEDFERIKDKNNIRYDEDKNIYNFNNIKKSNNKYKWNYNQDSANTEKVTYKTEDNIRFKSKTEYKSDNENSRNYGYKNGRNSDTNVFKKQTYFDEDNNDREKLNDVDEVEIGYNNNFSHKNFFDKRTITRNKWNNSRFNTGHGFKNDLSNEYHSINYRGYSSKNRKINEDNKDYEINSARDCDSYSLDPQNKKYKNSLSYSYNSYYDTDNTKNENNEIKDTCNNNNKKYFYKKENESLSINKELKINQDDKYEEENNILRPHILHEENNFKIKTDDQINHTSKNKDNEQKPDIRMTLEVETNKNIETDPISKNNDNLQSDNNLKVIDIETETDENINSISNNNCNLQCSNNKKSTELETNTNEEMDFKIKNNYNSQKPSVIKLSKIKTNANNQIDSISKNNDNYQELNSTELTDVQTNLNCQINSISKNNDTSQKFKSKKLRDVQTNLNGQINSISKNNDTSQKFKSKKLTDVQTNSNGQINSISKNNENSNDIRLTKVETNTNDRNKANKLNKIPKSKSKKKIFSTIDECVDKEIKKQDNSIAEILTHDNQKEKNEDISGICSKTNNAIKKLVNNRSYDSHQVDQKNKISEIKDIINCVSPNGNNLKSQNNLESVDFVTSKVFSNDFQNIPDILDEKIEYNKCKTAKSLLKTTSNYKLKKDKNKNSKNIENSMRNNVKILENTTNNAKNESFINIDDLQKNEIESNKNNKISKTNIQNLDKNGFQTIKNTDNLKSNSNKDSSRTSTKNSIKITNNDQGKQKKDIKLSKKKLISQKPKTNSLKRSNLNSELKNSKKENLKHEKASIDQKNDSNCLKIHENTKNLKQITDEYQFFENKNINSKKLKGNMSESKEKSNMESEQKNSNYITDNLQEIEGTKKEKRNLIEKKKEKEIKQQSSEEINIKKVVQQLNLKNELVSGNEKLLNSEYNKDLRNDIVIDTENNDGKGFENEDLKSKNISCKKIRNSRKIIKNNLILKRGIKKVKNMSKSAEKKQDINTKDIPDNNLEIGSNDKEPIDEDLNDPLCFKNKHIDQLNLIEEETDNHLTKYTEYNSEELKSALKFTIKNISDIEQQISENKNTHLEIKSDDVIEKNKKGIILCIKKNNKILPALIKYIQKNKKENSKVNVMENKSDNIDSENQIKDADEILEANNETYDIKICSNKRNSFIEKNHDMRSKDENERCKFNEEFKDKIEVDTKNEQIEVENFDIYVNKDYKTKDTNKEKNLIFNERKVEIISEKLQTDYADSNLLIMKKIERKASSNKEDSNEKISKLMETYMELTKPEINTTEKIEEYINTVQECTKIMSNKNKADTENNNVALHNFNYLKIDEIEIPEEKIWTDEENAIFNEEISRTTKGFPNVVYKTQKTIKDVILHYYRSKINNEQLGNNKKRKAGRTSDEDMIGIVEKEWTEKELRTFMNYMGFYSKEWKMYVKRFSGRTEKDVKLVYRYCKKYRSGKGCDKNSRKYNKKTDIGIQEPLEIEEKDHENLNTELEPTTKTNKSPSRRKKQSSEKNIEQTDFNIKYKKKLVIENNSKRSRKELKENKDVLNKISSKFSENNDIENEYSTKNGFLMTECNQNKFDGSNLVVNGNDENFADFKGIGNENHHEPIIIEKNEKGFKIKKKELYNKNELSAVESITKHNNIENNEVKNDYIISKNKNSYNQKKVPLNKEAFKKPENQFKFVKSDKKDPLNLVLSIREENEFKDIRIEKKDPKNGVISITSEIEYKGTNNKNKNIVDSCETNPIEIKDKNLDQVKMPIKKRGRKRKDEKNDSSTPINNKKISVKPKPRKITQTNNKSKKNNAFINTNNKSEKIRLNNIQEKNKCIESFTINQRQLFAIYYPYIGKNWSELSKFVEKPVAELRNYYRFYFKDLHPNEKIFEANIRELGSDMTNLKRSMSCITSPIQKYNENDNEHNQIAGIIFRNKKRKFE